MAQDHGVSLEDLERPHCHAYSQFLWPWLQRAVSCFVHALTRRKGLFDSGRACAATSGPAVVEFIEHLVHPGFPEWVVGSNRELDQVAAGVSESRATDAGDFPARGRAMRSAFWKMAAEGESALSSGRARARPAPDYCCRIQGARAMSVRRRNRTPRERYSAPWPVPSTARGAPDRQLAPTDAHGFQRDRDRIIHSSSFRKQK
jgi:hypothetical protein